MNCRHARNRLSEYIDGELSAVEHARVLAHLRECPKCRAEEAALRRTACLAQTWGSYQPGPELGWRLDPAFLAERARVPERVPWSVRLQVLAAPVAVVATALLLVASGNPFRPEPSGSKNAVVARVPEVAPPVPVMPEAMAPSPVQESVSAPVGKPTAERVAPVPAPSERAESRESDTLQPEPAAARVARRTPSSGMARAPSRPVRRAPAKPAARPVMLARAEPAKAPEPLTKAEDLYASGRYVEAAGVLNAAFERSSTGVPAQVRSLYVERNALADAAIAECSGALRQDPGNANARKFLDEAYESKVALLRSLTG